MSLLTRGALSSYALAGDLVSGLTDRKILGSNLSVSNAQTSDIWAAGETASNERIIFPTAAGTLDIVSDNTGDTVAGVGARTIQVEGLDAAGIPIRETIELNGTSAVTTTLSYFRLNNASVTTSGSVVSSITGGQLGIITITETGNGNVLGKMLIKDDVPLGNPRNSHFTIPSNRRGFVKKLVVSTIETQTADVYLLTRDLNIPNSPLVQAGYFTGMTGVVELDFNSNPIDFGSFTDIWACGRGKTGTTEIQIAYTIDLVERP